MKRIKLKNARKMGAINESCFVCMCVSRKMGQYFKGIAVSAGDSLISQYCHNSLTV